MIYLNILNYDSRELKISLAREEGSIENSYVITENDSCMEIFDKVSNDIYCSLEMTKKSLDTNMLEAAAKNTEEALQNKKF